MLLLLPLPLRDDRAAQLPMRALEAARKSWRKRLREWVTKLAAKSALRGVAVSLLLWLVIAILPAAGADCVLRVSYAEDSRLAFKGADGEHHGADLDVVREALRRGGCEARFVNLPWSRAIAALRSGAVDLLTGILETEERRSFAYFSRPIQKSRNYLFLRLPATTAGKLTRLTDLIGTDFRLGVEMGSDFGSDFQQLVHDPRFSDHLFQIQSYESAWRMMEAGRLDGFITEEHAGQEALQRLGLKGHILRSDLVVTESPDRVAFSRRTAAPQRVEQFNQAFESMLRDGSYQRILEQYLRCTVSVEKLGCA